jgi:hypothetical protein
MFYKDSHLLDQELLMAADGELPERRQKRVQRHLQSCWTCRKRMAEVEGTIADVVDCYHDLLDAQMPPGNGSEALLRARLGAESSSCGSQRVHWPRIALAAGAVLIVAMTGFLFTRPQTGVIPNPSLTPGEALPVSKSDVCQANNKGDNAEVPDELRRVVFTEYGLNNAPPNAYEVDFLITPALGGSASIRNLWPEPYNSRSWNAHTKDILEHRLHTLVCNGELDLAVAQRDIAANWVDAYKKYVGPGNPM